MSGPVLPETWRTRPFTVGELRDAGLPPSRLRHSALHLPTRSVRSARPVVTVAERAAAFAKALPEDVAFSHGTAALLLGLPLPGRFEGSVVLDVMRDSSRTPIRRKLCAGHRGLESRTVVEVAGLRVVAARDTWCDLGELVCRGLTIDDLVVAADEVLNRLGPDAATLEEALAQRCRPRGSKSLEEAVARARPGVRSPMESRTRLMFVRAGFPEPEVNAEVLDAHGGWLLEGDLLWREQRVIGEYQGADHASIKRRSADASRATVAEAEGYRTLEIFAEDVYRGARRRACLTRFARALLLDPAHLRIA
jgi:hypothetical protein